MQIVLNIETENLQVILGWKSRILLIQGVYLWKKEIKLFLREHLLSENLIMYMEIKVVAYMQQTIWMRKKVI